MNRQQRTLLMLAGGAVAYVAIKNSGAPAELPISEGNDLVLDAQASSSPIGMDSDQFERMVDDIVTVNGIIVVLTPSNKLNTTSNYYVSPNATREQLNLVISQVNNALRNKVQFSTVQEVTLKNVSSAAHRHLVGMNIRPPSEGQLDNKVTLNGLFSLDGIF